MSLGGAGSAAPGVVKVPARYAHWVNWAAVQTGLDPDVVAAQIWTESRFRPGVTSPAGAEGIAQFEPATFAQYGLGSPFNVADAFNAYVHYMSALLGRFKGNVTSALSAYNSGSATSGAGQSYAAEVLSESQHVTGLNGQGGTVPASERKDAAFITWLKKAIGTPYLWGGQNPFQGGADCAGLVRYSLGKAGIQAPAGTRAQWAWVQQFHDPKQLKPGDLVFLNFPGETSPGHVAVWLGGNKIIQDSHTGAPVAVASFNPQTTPGQWGATLVGFGRVPGIGAPVPATFTGSGAAGSAGGGGQGGGGGSSDPGITGVIGTLLGGLFPADPLIGAQAQQFSSGGPLGDIGTAITGIAGGVAKIASIIDWFVVPSHEIRLMCGLAGSVLVLGGIYEFSHVSGALPGASLPVGMVAVGIGAVLLFVSLHNLPSDVTDFPGLLSYVQQAIHGQAQPAGAEAGGGSIQQLAAAS